MAWQRRGQGRWEKETSYWTPGSQGRATRRGTKWQSGDYDERLARNVAAEATIGAPPYAVGPSPAPWPASPRAATATLASPASAAAAGSDRRPVDQRVRTSGGPLWPSGTYRK